MSMDNLGIWIAAIGTLAILSFALRENKAYRLFEHIYIGAAAAHAVVVGVQTLRNSAWNPLVQNGRYVLLIPILLGVLMYARYIPRQAWLSRLPLSFMVGLGTGMIMRGTIASQFISQIKATLVPLDSLGNIVVVFGTSAVLLFFYFSRERTGLLKQYTHFGRWIMMVAFGATFGNAVMGEMTLLIGRLQFLFRDWLGIIN